MEKQLIDEGIVVKTLNYGEKDVIITIFTKNYGIRSAILKSVKAPNAKLKFASQILCCAEFKFTDSSGLGKLIGATDMGSYFGLARNYKKMVVASAVLEMATQSMYYGEPNPALYEYLKNALVTMLRTEIEPEIIMLRFALEMLNQSGYKLNLYECRLSERGLSGEKVVFDTKQGEIFNMGQTNNHTVDLDIDSLKLLQNIENKVYKDLSGVEYNVHQLYQCRILLEEDFKLKFGTELRCFKSFDTF